MDTTNTTYDIEDALDEGHALRVVTEYDRSVRAYRTLILDERDYQVGTGAYDGTKADRDASAEAFERLIASVQAAR